MRWRSPPASSASARQRSTRAVVMGEHLREPAGDAALGVAEQRAPAPRRSPPCQRSTPRHRPRCARVTAERRWTIRRQCRAGGPAARVRRDLRPVVRAVRAARGGRDQRGRRRARPRAAPVGGRRVGVARRRWPTRSARSPPPASSTRSSAGTSPRSARPSRRGSPELVPYVYTALYEGGERTPGVFLTGEVPSRQLLPAMQLAAPRARRPPLVDRRQRLRLAARHRARGARLRAACATGRSATRRSCRSAAARGGRSSRTSSARAPDAVLMLLVGEDAVTFNRAFAAAGLDSRCRRLSTLIDENTLAGSGADEHARHLRRGRLLRDAGHAREPGLRLALHAALRPRRADAQQRRRVLLRGRAAALRARRAGRQPRRARG